MPVSAESTLVLAPHAVSHVLEDTVALLDINTGVYYTLDGAGIILMAACGTGTSLTEIAQQVCREYEVDEEQALADLIELAEELVAEGLVVVDGA